MRGRGREKKSLDEFHQHEALHAAHMLTASFREYVADIQFVEAHPEVKAPTDEAVRAMGKVYQAIGTIEFVKLNASE